MYLPVRRHCQKRKANTVSDGEGGDWVGCRSDEAKKEKLSKQLKALTNILRQGYFRKRLRKGQWAGRGLEQFVITSLKNSLSQGNIGKMPDTNTRMCYNDANAGHKGQYLVIS